MRKVTIEVTVEFREPGGIAAAAEFEISRNAKEFEKHIGNAVDLFCEARYGAVDSFSVDNRRVVA
jgi:hypothetical protein